jgi:hypothetical protein
VKKVLIFGLVLIFLSTVLLADKKYGHKAFLASAISVNATVTKVNVTDFTSLELTTMNPQVRDIAAIIVTFTRAAGTSSTVDFKFEASYDGGTTWALLFDATGEKTFSVATNTVVISGTTVAVLFQINTGGVTNLRLRSVYNSDATNNITAVNATLSH